MHMKVLITYNQLKNIKSKHKNLFCYNLKNKLLSLQKTLTNSDK